MRFRYGMTIGIVLILAGLARAQSPGVAGQVESLLRVHCYSCHGQDEKKLKGDLRVLDHAQLLNPKREPRLVTPGDAAKSELLARVEDESMPPGNRPKLTEAERELIKTWIASGVPAFSGGASAPTLTPLPPKPAVESPRPADLNEAVKILATHCHECHGGKKSAAGVKILDRDLLVSRNFIVPGKPDQSPLLKLLHDGEPHMPPAPRPSLTADQVKTLREWIAEGAHAGAQTATTPAAPPPVKLGTEYILQSILADVRRLGEKERRHVRYFSLLHLANAGATKEELDRHRDAFAKAINHLSWKPEIVRPTFIETTRTILRVDIRDLGWDEQPFRRVLAGKPDQPSGIDLFDLVLLEYPYAVLPEKSDLYFPLLRDFLVPARQVRPVPFVRADWFVSVATQPPLYHDLLQLPQTLDELERKLGVNPEANIEQGRAARAGMIVSGVSRNNRVVERHDTSFGAYWKSFDFRTSQAQENVFRDPIDLHPAGGEMVFNLPNGLEGYLIVDDQGRRIDAAPTSIVVDEHASDRTVRNGLSCMRCHDKGVKGYADTVRPAVLKLPGSAIDDRRQVLQLYPEQSVHDKLLKSDEDRFLAAVEKALGKPQTADPLKPVSTRFLDERLSLASASGELGLSEPDGLEKVFRLPQFTDLGLAALAAKQQLSRDAWELYYDRVVGQLGLGTPVVPLDGLNRLQHEPDPKPFDLEVKTNRRGNLFATGDELVIFVKPSKDVFIEMIATNTSGTKTVIAPATTHLRAGQTYRYPPEGQKFTVKSAVGQALVTVFASESPFNGGVVLRGEGVADRVLHPWPVKVEGKQAEVQFNPDPARTVKRTVVLEVR